MTDSTCFFYLSYPGGTSGPNLTRWTTGSWSQKTGLADQSFILLQGNETLMWQLLLILTNLIGQFGFHIRSNFFFVSLLLAQTIWFFIRFACHVKQITMGLVGRVGYPLNVQIQQGGAAELPCGARPAGGREPSRGGGHGCSTLCLQVENTIETVTVTVTLSNYHTGISARHYV